MSGPETQAGRALLAVIRSYEQPEAAPGAGPHADIATAPLRDAILAIEAEASEQAVREALTALREQVEPIASRLAPSERAYYGLTDVLALIDKAQKGADE